MSRYPAWVKVLAVITGIVAVVVLARACSSPDDPRKFIADTYRRTASLDEGQLQAYLARGKGPHAVATEISAEVQPIDRRSVPDPAGANADDAVFLQYGDQIVAVFAHEGGSRVMVGEYRAARSHYIAFIGGYWPATPSYGGTGSGNRGGGSGTGK